MNCPHCHEPYPAPPASHRCADRRRWTREERDEWRAQARKRNPAISFAPSTEEMATRFGHMSRRTERA